MQNVRPRGRTASVLLLDVEIGVVNYFHANPRESLKNASLDLNISKTSLYKILKKHKFRAWKMSYAQKLLARDYLPRLEFCDWALEYNGIEAEETFFQNCIVGDEAMLYTNGRVNRQNCRYWSVDNPEFELDSNDQSAERVMVWGGFFGDRILGPYFFDGNVNGINYLEMLENYVWPAIQNLVNERTIFIHDGAPSHLRANEWLREKFGENFVSRNGAIPWPARSPDLTPCDFFLWGYVRSKVFNHVRVQNMEDMIGRIQEAFNAITPAMLARVRRNWRRRTEACILMQGGHFEKRLKN